MNPKINAESTDPENKFHCNFRPKKVTEAPLF